MECLEIVGVYMCGVLGIVGVYMCGEYRDCGCVHVWSA